MVELFEKQIVEQKRKSSKGNQLKWFDGEYWYKADYTGYEGLAEYVISQLLKKSSLQDMEFVTYETEEIKYKNQIMKGCKSRNFLKDDWQIITLERLFKNYTQESLTKSVYEIENYENRLLFIVKETERITGLKEFGKYMSKILTIDAFFLNEDRHMHNIAVLMNSKEEYQLCPIFDNGAALMSDIALDYPLGGSIFGYEKEVRAKTFCDDFTQQLDIAENLYGQNIKFFFHHSDVEKIAEETKYDNAIKERVTELIFQRMRSFEYLFEK